VLESAMIWNMLLSLAAAAIMWWFRGINIQVEELKKSLAATREEIAKSYALKEDVEKDIDKLMTKFDKVEAKLDNMISHIMNRMGQIQ